MTTISRRVDWPGIGDEAGDEVGVGLVDVVGVSASRELSNALSFSRSLARSSEIEAVRFKPRKHSAGASGRVGFGIGIADGAGDADADGAADDCSDGYTGFGAAAANSTRRGAISSLRASGRGCLGVTGVVIAVMRQRVVGKVDRSREQNFRSALRKKTQKSLRSSATAVSAMQTPFLRGQSFYGLKTTLGPRGNDIRRHWCT